MSSLLDCYSSLTEQLNKITVSSNPLIYVKTIQQQQKYFNQKFHSTLLIVTQKIDHNKTFQIQSVDKNHYNITFLYDSIYPGLDILTKFQFNLLSYQISITSTILKNYQPIKIKQKQLRLSINRYLIRINSASINGSLRLNPLNGQLIFCITSLLTIHQFQSYIYQPMKLVQFLNQQLLKSKHYLRMHIYKILYLMNQVDQNYANNPMLYSYQIKTVNSYYRSTINLIDKILPFIHLEFPFMYNDQAYSNGSNIKNISPDFIRKTNEMIKLLKYNSKVLQENVLKSIESLTNQKYKNIKTSENYTFTDQQKKDFTSILLPTYSKIMSGQPQYAYSQIQIRTDKQIKWDILDQGGFGMIRKANVQFFYKRDTQKYQPRINQTFFRTLVKKDDIEHNAKSKLNHEKEILSNMKHSISPFIAKFFYSQQELYKNSLIIEYYPSKSFNHHRAKNKQFMTLNTKLIFLKFIAQSIKFLKDHKICHLDLKPANILFGNGHIKLTDFGQAYHPQVCQKNFRPGTSLPYAPPESFSPDLINFSDKLDIFSYGMVMYEILFDCYPIQYSKYHYYQIKKSYSQKSYLELVQLLTQKSEYIGFKKTYKYLIYLVLRCLDKQEKKRPCIQWIIIVLQCCISLEQHLYYW